LIGNQAAVRPAAKFLNPRASYSLFDLGGGEAFSLTLMLASFNLRFGFAV
jgi:hypothetical protein